MKTLSIRQPWVELIFQRRKTLEIRRWSTDYRGEILIHSAYNLDRAALKDYPVKDAPRSAIVGIVSIDNVEELTERTWREYAKRHLSTLPWDPETCRYGFWLSGAVRFVQPRSCIGRSFLWETDIA